MRAMKLHLISCLLTGRRANYLFLVVLSMVTCAGVKPAWCASSTTTQLTITSAGSPVTSTSSGSVVTLTAMVVSGNSSVTVGQVNFCDATAAACTGTHLFGTAQLTTAGTAALSFVPGVGSHSYKAVFLGTSSAASSTSSASPLTVTGGSPSTTTITSTGSTGAYSLTATVAGIGSAAPTGNVSILNASNGNAVLDTAPLTANPAAFNLVNLTNPTVTAEPIDVSDFNGDGILDIAVSGNPITILLGNGDGTFKTTPESSVAGPGPIVVGDFNGDGKADIAVANPSSNTVTVLLGGGDGTFTAVATASTTNSPNAIVSSDFNGDGNEDLAVTNSSGNSVTVLLGNGDGTFTAVATSPTLGGSPQAIAAGDFDGNGIPDLVVANEGSGTTSNTLTILLGNGDGTFTATAASPVISVAPSCLAVGDFNGDGNLDIAVGLSENSSSPVTVFLGAGNGTFTSGPAVGTSIYPAASIVAGDFNGDGKLDLATGGPQSCDASGCVNGEVVLLGNGDGTFSAFPFPEQATFGYGGYYIAGGDFNGDGVADLAYATGSVVSILLTTNQSATATVNGSIVPPASGSVQVVASYPSDANYKQSISNTISLASSMGTPTVSETATPNPVAFGKPVTLTATVTGTGAAPTGSVTFVDSNGQLGMSSLNSSGVATYSVSGLPIGAAAITANYSGDTNYSAVNSAPLTVTVTSSATGVATVTLSPSSASFYAGVAQPVSISVSGASGGATPTGTVTLSGGGYMSAATPLASGAATITIPAKSLAAGSNTMTATYSGDTVYGSATGTAAFTVSTTAPGFTISGTAVSLSPGASTANTSTISVNPVPVSGFSGSVALSAAISSSPAGATNVPTLSFGATSSVNLSGTAPGSATLTVSTTPPTTSDLLYPRRYQHPWYTVGGGSALACVLLFGIPARRRSWRKAITGCLLLILSFAFGMVGCGSGSGNPMPGNSGTTPGAYQITVTGTSGSINESTTVTLTVQ
jgi:hypothetical protein